MDTKDKYSTEFKLLVHSSVPHSHLMDKKKQKNNTDIHSALANTQTHTHNQTGNIFFVGLQSDVRPLVPLLSTDEGQGLCSDIEL